MFYAGIPFALLGFGFIAGSKWFRWLYFAIVVWAGASFYVWIIRPYQICPIELPRGARGLKVSKESFQPSAYSTDGSNTYYQVKCFASVDACLAAAEKIAKEKKLKPSTPVAGAKVVFENVVLKLNNSYPPGNADQAWFKPSSIENGIRFVSDHSVIYIDYDRSIFYYQEFRYLEEAN